MKSIGALVVAHGGGPTAVMNSSLAGAVWAAQRRGFGPILGARGGVEGLLREQFIDLTKIDEDTLRALRKTPGSAIGSCRYKVRPEDHSRIVEALNSVGARAFLYNGGNDSMDTCLKVAKTVPDVRVIGIPKTIDNDLEATDHAPGFGSAARYYAQTAVELSLDVKALPIHVCVLEIMGRNAGWLTAAAALGRQFDLPSPAMLVVPERPLNPSEFLASVESLWSRTGGFVIAASEGARNAEGRPLVAGMAAGQRDPFGHPLPGGVSVYLADLITRQLGIRARAEKPGLVGRASRALMSQQDDDEAFEVGAYAVELAESGVTQRMVTIEREPGRDYRIRFGSVPLEQVANRERLLPLNALSPDEGVISQWFADYALPLIGGDLPDYLMLEAS